MHSLSTAHSDYPSRSLPQLRLVSRLRFAAGTASPRPCGNVTVFCPAGSVAPTVAAAGFYTEAAAVTNATNVMARAVECPPGSFCAGGVRFPCPAGTFVGDSARTTVSECLSCSAGGFCPAGVGAPVPCGDDSVYCPAGSSAPEAAGAGYYTQGVPGSRSTRALCGTGVYCPGDGRAYTCPAGRYGDVLGLTNASCSGTCADGVLCPARTVSAAGQPCPSGQYCVGGVGYPCPSGTFNPLTGAVNASQCQLCPAGTFNAGNGSPSEADCLPCPQYEGSLPGATACWPGIAGP
jgi:hypothetical protein